MENYLEKNLMRKNKNLIVLAVVLGVVLLLLLIAGILLFRQNSEIKASNLNLIQQVDSVVIIKDTAEKEILVQKDANKELQDKLNINRQEIDKLTTLIDQKNARISQLRRFQAEVVELKKAKEALKIQLDKSLAERESLKKELEGLNLRLAALTQDLTDLQKKAELASKLNAYNICFHNSRVTRAGRIRCTDMARRANQTEIEFEIGDNIFAPVGEKRIHLVFSGPDNNVVQPSGKFILYNTTNEIDYTNAISIQYTGKRSIQKFTIRHPERLTAGKYTAAVYIDGKLAGTSEFNLN